MQVAVRGEKSFFWLFQVILALHHCFGGNFWRFTSDSWPKSIFEKGLHPGFGSQPAVPFDSAVPRYHISVSAMIRGNHLDPPLYIPLF